MSYGSTVATVWDRTLYTTLPKHLRKVEENVFRNHQILALIKNKGNVSYNNGGEGITWPVQYKRHRGQGDLGEGPRSFQRVNQWKTAKLDYRGTTVTDSISRREMYSNQGEEAVVKFADGIISRLTDSLNEEMAPQCYNDGEATGNETSWHGLKSWHGFSGTVDTDSGALNLQNSGGDQAADKLGWANSTYAGLSCELGAYTGSNSSGDKWPAGTADPQYDFWTPLVVNYNSTAFSGATHTWAVQAIECLRFGLTYSSRRAGAESQITNILMSMDMWIPFIALYEPLQRIMVTGDSPLRKFGFQDVVFFDGRETSCDAACPPGNAFGMNPATFEILCMTEQMFMPEPGTYDNKTQTTDYAVSTLSNLKSKSPGRQARWTNVTDNGPG